MMLGVAILLTGITDRTDAATAYHTTTGRIQATAEHRVVFVDDDDLLRGRGCDHLPCCDTVPRVGLLLRLTVHAGHCQLPVAVVAGAVTAYRDGTVTHRGRTFTLDDHATIARARAVRCGCDGSTTAAVFRTGIGMRMSSVSRRERRWRWSTCCRLHHYGFSCCGSWATTNTTSVRLLMVLVMDVVVLLLQMFIRTEMNTHERAGGRRQCRRGNCLLSIDGRRNGIIIVVQLLRDAVFIVIVFHLAWKVHRFAVRHCTIERGACVCGKGIYIYVQTHTHTYTQIA
uniref:Secreted protein n=1 Tax=Anopheles culicifacies TaxID=139723 RepID=A0A182LZZ3_9DIPT